METERRKNPRVQVDVQGEIILGDRSCPALMLNVSLGGCLIETSARPRMREIISFKVKQGMSVEECKLKVVWQSFGQGLGKIGAQFYGMSENEIHGVVARILGISHRNREGEKDES